MRLYKTMKKMPELKILRRDRYGVLRGTALLCLMIVVAMSLNMYLHSNRDTLTAEERASDAARQISAQFQQMIEDCISQLNVAAESIRGNTREGFILDALSRNTIFSAAAIIEEGSIIYSSGEVNMQDEEGKSAEHVYGDVSARIIAQDDNSIQLRVSIVEGTEIAAWISSDRVREVLGCAYPEAYGYAIYNDDTGIYLINHTHFTEHGYYDALLERNDSNEAEKLLNAPLAQAYFSNDPTASEAYYIAQMPTEIASWHIALLIPQRLIDFNEGLPKGLYYIGLITIVVCAVMVVIEGLYVRRKISKSNRRHKKESELVNQLAELAVMRGQVAVFQYKRKEDVLLHYIDGISRQNLEESRGISGLAEVFGLESGEVLRLRERCMKLKAGAEDEINVHSHVNGTERFLQISIKSNADNENVILGCIIDCTQGMLSANRIVDERNFFSAMKAKSSTVWQINVGRNRWHICHCVDSRIMEQIGVKDRSERDYENDLNNLLRRYLHPEDYPSYADEMSINGLMNMFRKGKLETVHEYRTVNSRKNGYEWHRQVVRIFQQPETQEIMANIFIINVDAEKNAEMERRERSRMLQRSLTALGGLYRALFYVDLDNNICYTTKAPGGELISKHQSAFRDTFDAFIDRAAAPEDRQALKDLTSAYLLRKNLSEVKHSLQHEYLRISGDNLKRTVMVVQAARFENGTVREVVIAIRNLE